jgi:uncharacterized membrane protein (DUF373 family)
MSDETAIDGPFDLDGLIERSEYVMRLVEAVAALVLVLLFAIGVGDLGLQILQAIQGGGITDPQVVIGFIDTALLMLIIVEVYQTVIAYTRKSETRQIVRLVLYTGVIAMVRKAIIFRTEVYATKLDALLAASAYALLLVGIGGLLLVEQRCST